MDQDNYKIDMVRCKHCGAFFKEILLKKEEFLRDMKCPNCEINGYLVRMKLSSFGWV
jgi:hypothetical protein